MPEPVEALAKVCNELVLIVQALVLLLQGTNMKGGV
jgi:hypothetical protein